MSVLRVNAIMTLRLHVGSLLTLVRRLMVTLWFDPGVGSFYKGPHEKPELCWRAEPTIT